MADEQNLTPGQQLLLEEIKEQGREPTAELFAYLNFFGRDIEELTAEELSTIPKFLLDPWLADNPPKD